MSNFHFTKNVFRDTIEMLNYINYIFLGEKMKKNLTIFVIILTMLIAAALALGACNGYYNGDDKNDNGDNGYDIPILNYDFFEIDDNVIIELTELGREQTAIIIPASITIIGNNALGGATNLNTVVFEESSQLTTIGEGAFIGASSLTSLTIPASVTIIGAFAFAYATSLTVIMFEEGSQLMHIGMSAFASVTSLASITFPASVVTISSLAFGNTPSLLAINVDSANRNFVSVGGVLYDRNNATLVAVPSGITTLTIPSWVWFVNDGVFSHTINLKAIYVENGNTQFTSTGGILYNIGSTALIAAPRGIVSVSIPATVTNIMNNAFSGAINLTTLVFEQDSQLTRIGMSAFQGTINLTSIIIPYSVTTISFHAFYGWTETQTIYVEGRTVAPSGWSPDWFGDSTANVVWLGQEVVF